MTFWATLWYAGSVVISIGYEGQTLPECRTIGELMKADIVSAYDDPAKQQELAQSMFPVNKFVVTCETKRLGVDEKYAKVAE